MNAWRRMSTSHPIPQKSPCWKSFVGLAVSWHIKPRQLGYRAERCGKAQCDLQSVSGRKHVFSQVIQKRPKSIWFSPTCGPWAGFSSLNGSRSLKAWDELQKIRLSHPRADRPRHSAVPPTEVNRPTFPLGAAQKLPDVPVAISSGSAALSHGCWCRFMRSRWSQRPSEPIAHPEIPNHTFHFRDHDSSTDWITV